MSSADPELFAIDYPRLKREARRWVGHRRLHLDSAAHGIVKAAYADLWPAVEAGKLGLPIDRTFALDEVTKALAHMRATAHFGKIVLAV
jgi:NADPH:quinone reductase-like Zn-dependent oxidoreductase